MEITLDSGAAEFVRHGVASGRFSSASEMIRLALDLLKDPEERMRFETLRSALADGIQQADRGELVDLDLDALKKEIRHEAAG